MAYYGGIATDYNDLLNAIVNACVDQGWAWSDNILNKDTAFVRVTYNSTGVHVNGRGIQFQGGMGRSSGNLENPSTAVMRIGSFNLSASIFDPSFPLQYHIFIFENPNEVYIVIKYDIDRFQFACFGLSTIAGNGLWLSATLGLRQGNSNFGIYISENTGGNTISTGYVSSSGPFWQNYTSNFSDAYALMTQTINTTIDSLGWSHLASLQGNTPANISLFPLFGRLPSNWSAETILLPIQPLIQRESFKSSILADLRNARYLRIDHLEPEQILEIGGDKWMVFPFHRKNISQRNGGSNIDHTGTFAWAIRYDGP